MTATITAQTPARLVFDKDGDVDQHTMDDLVDAIRTAAVTDLFIFSHGWNNDEAAATSLYKRWFALLAAQVKPGRNVGYVGIRWPAQLWRDEPIPEFPAAPAADHQGAAALDENPVIEAGAPTIDPAELADLKDMFPTGSKELDAIAGLLAQPPTSQTATKLFAAMREFSSAVGVDSNDGEADPSKEPGMLDKERAPVDVFTKFADGLSQAGVDFGDGGGEAGLGDFGAKLLHGAQGSPASTHLLADEEPRRRGRTEGARSGDRPADRRVPQAAHPPHRAQLRSPPGVLRVGRNSRVGAISGQIGHPA